MKTTKRRSIKARNYQVKNQVAEITENTSKGRYSFGLNDRLPNELIRDVQDSGTAMLCIGKRKSFIQGDGVQG